MSDQSADDHDGLNCPQCQAATQAVQILGGFGEAMQKILDNGVLERMGREAGMRREQAFMDAFLGADAPTIVEKEQP